MDAAVVSHVLQNGMYLAARTVFCYVSLPQEIDTHPILLDAWSSGKRVAIPRCRKNGRMDFFIVRDQNDLLPGMRGISEPKDDRPLCVPLPDDLCIVPCLGMDRNGYRLGYGGGYYDRYLSKYAVRTLGLCYHACVIRDLPIESFDIKLQMFITEKEV